MRLPVILAALMASTFAWGAALTPAQDKHIARMGRVAALPDGGVRIAYPGVTLSLTFTGTSLSVDAWSSGAGSYLEAVVDGGAPRRIKIGSERASYPILEHGARGKHTVELMHRSETWHGVVTLAGITADGPLGAPPALPKRRMLVLGDSVSCSEGVGERTGKKDSTWWDPRHSYGMLAARALHAQVQLVCHGGRGLVRSWNGRTDEHNLPDFYQLAVADPKQPLPWNQRDYDPQLIVSAIGTNDFNQGIPERDAYVSAYVHFVRTLLADHPRAQVVLTEGAILNGDKKAALQAYLRETRERVGDKRVHVVPSIHHPGTQEDAHPTGPEHAQMAQELVPQLARIMHW